MVLVEAILLTLLSANEYQISIKPEKVYLGYFPHDEEIEMVLEISNKSRYPVKILKALPYCDCLKIDKYDSIAFPFSEAKIYYIEIILISGGPDTFTLISHISPNDKELTRYYLPIIPGFPLEYLIISFLIALGTIYILHKKKVRR